MWNRHVRLDLRALKRVTCLNCSWRDQVPVDLVIDHSVQVDVSRSANALQSNMELEFSRNKERFGFLKWGATAFKNMLVVPPGSGIVHQVCAPVIKPRAG